MDNERWRERESERKGESDIYMGLGLQVKG